MQKLCWSIIEKNQSNTDIQIKTIEQLHIISDKLTELYESLPYHVEFGARRHFYIDKCFSSLLICKYWECLVLSISHIRTYAKKL
jgi:hypothetical protein